MTASVSDIKEWIYLAAKQEYDSKYSTVKQAIRYGLDQDHANYGPTVAQIASKQQLLTQRQVYQQLAKYKENGIIMMHKPYKGAMCRWWYEGLLDELRSSDA